MDTHNTKRYPYVELKSPYLPDRKCKKCGATVSDQYGYCTNCLAPFNVESNSEPSSKSHHGLGEWLRRPIETSRPQIADDAEPETSDTDTRSQSGMIQWLSSGCDESRPSHGRGWIPCIAHREISDFPDHICTCDLALVHRGLHHCSDPHCPYPNRSWS